MCRRFEAAALAAAVAVGAGAGGGCRPSRPDVRTTATSDAEVMRAAVAAEEAGDREAIGGFFQSTRLPGGLSGESQSIEKNLGIR